MRIVHLSDIHIWRYVFNPLRLFSKRALGIVELMAGRARRFRLERLAVAGWELQLSAGSHVLGDEPHRRLRACRRVPRRSPAVAADTMTPAAPWPSG